MLCSLIYVYFWLWLYGSWSNRNCILCMYSWWEKTNQHVGCWWPGVNLVLEISENKFHSSVTIITRVTPAQPSHGVLINWKHFPRHWPFGRGIHRWPVNRHEGQWRGVLMFSLIFAWIHSWVNNCEAGGLRRHRAHYDVTVMVLEMCDVRIPLDVVRTLRVCDNSVETPWHRMACIRVKVTLDISVNPNWKSMWLSEISRVRTWLGMPRVSPRTPDIWRILKKKYQHLYSIILALFLRHKLVKHQ